MAVELRGVTVVVLPGTGSDDVYVDRAFAGPLRGVGARILAPPPEPGGLIDCYRAALDDAARRGPIAVGGISLGAAVAAAWALAHPETTVAVLAALPAWTGTPDGAPAARAARHSADHLRRDGLAAATTQLRASSPPWLAEELTRSWRRLWPYLPDALEEAADYVAPTRAELARLDVPMGIAAATDDPVHPFEVGVAWAAAAPRASVCTVTLAQIGADPAALGAACLAALASV
ncbi:alpha/beta hydrolase [Mycobacterium sp.]|uniref:serine aminopeptidase domain-containing protein n=1 Tax=Mycobacterium sp. TaxID=1785 RepID=UPI00126D59BE|nr:alpha/beta hydrolase [Mycobacterium sp.]KAA8958313.1 MAG: alpha/beta fold hydrolase [Mycobacterium sp.]